jgi:hypothetical protein
MKEPTTEELDRIQCDAYMAARERGFGPVEAYQAGIRAVFEFGVKFKAQIAPRRMNAEEEAEANVRGTRIARGES